jgi:hypothetical protein
MRRTQICRAFRSRIHERRKLVPRDIDRLETGSDSWKRINGTGLVSERSGPDPRQKPKARELL